MYRLHINGRSNYVTPGYPSGRTFNTVETDRVWLYVGTELQLSQPIGAASIYENTATHRLQFTVSGGKPFTDGGTPPTTLGRQVKWYKIVGEDDDLSTESDDIQMPAAEWVLGDPEAVSLDLYNVKLSDGATYKCKVQDARGWKASATLQLNVYKHLVSPALTPDEPVGIENHPFTFEVVPDGGIPPFTFEWGYQSPETKAWTIIEAATEAAYTIETLAMSDAGEYQVFVSDSGTDLNRATNIVTLIVDPGIPVASGLGLSLLAAMCAAGGAFTMRRRKK